MVDNTLNIKYVDFYTVCDFDNMQYLIKKLQQNNFYTAHQMDWSICSGLLVRSQTYGEREGFHHKRMIIKYLCF